MLGLTPADLQRHIAWDIGAAGVARSLATGSFVADEQPSPQASATDAGPDETTVLPATIEAPIRSVSPGEYPRPPSPPRAALPATVTVRGRLNGAAFERDVAVKDVAADVGGITLLACG